jgi:chaperonin GroES
MAEKTTPIKPLSDRIVAVKEEARTQTSSGIFLPDSAKEKPVTASVQAVGKDVKCVKVGDTILYDEGYGKSTEVKVNGTEYIIVKEEDVLATI